MFVFLHIHEHLICDINVHIPLQRFFVKKICMTSLELEDVEGHS